MDPEVEVLLGDITQLRVDAIVNAANRSLLGGGGVDGAIHRACGPELAQSAQEFAPLDVGQAVSTPAFELAGRVKYVIHTVGPVWRGGDHDEAELLALCYRSCLSEATKLGLDSIAFPAISTGIYGYPRAEASRVAVESVLSAPRPLTRILLVAFDQETADLYLDALVRSSGSK